MIPTATSVPVAVVVLVVLVAGTTNGVAGFGFAVVGTMALATMIGSAVAVVFMIVPVLAVNVSLVHDLSHGLFVSVVVLGRRNGVYNSPEWSTPG